MTQITKKFITNNAVDGSKILLANNETLRARNAANSADISLFRLTSGDIFEITRAPRADATLPIPSALKEYATIEYIQNLIEGKTDVKDAVGYLSTTDFGGTFAPGNASTPATITNATAALTVDGKTFGAGDVNATYPMRIGVIGRTAGLQNGIYDLIAATASSYTLRRSSDFDGISSAGGQEITFGSWFRVALGTAFQGYEAQLTTADPITLNTTALTFVSYPSTISLIGGDMVLKTGNTFSVNLATNSGLESTNPGNVAGQLRAKTRTADPEKDRTVYIDATGNLAGRKTKGKLTTLAAGDITNQYIDLLDVASQDSVIFTVAGAGSQIETVDFTVNYTGGAGSKTRVTFAGGLASAGASALAAGDVVDIIYDAL